jgi:hypothetical protein
VTRVATVSMQPMAGLVRPMQPIEWTHERPPLAPRAHGFKPRDAVPPRARVPR